MAKVTGFVSFSSLSFICCWQTAGWVSCSQPLLDRLCLLQQICTLAYTSNFLFYSYLFTPNQLMEAQSFFFFLIFVMFKKFAWNLLDKMKIWLLTPLNLFSLNFPFFFAYSGDSFGPGGLGQGQWNANPCRSLPQGSLWHLWDPLLAQDQTGVCDYKHEFVIYLT